MNEIDNLRKENKELGDAISENDKLIDELSNKLLVLSKGRFNFDFYSDNDSFEQQLQNYHQQLITQKENELNQCKNEKQKLEQLILDQEQILQKQENQFHSDPFKTIDFHNKTELDISIHSNSHNINKYNTIQSEISKIETEIEQAKHLLLEKRNHIQSMKQKHQEISKMRSKLEEQTITSDYLQGTRTKIQILKQRVQDHQTFLLKPVDQLKNEYDTFRDVLLHHKTKNIEIQQSYSTVIADIQKNICN